MTEDRHNDNLIQPQQHTTHILLNVFMKRKIFSHTHTHFFSFSLSLVLSHISTLFLAFDYTVHTHFSFLPISDAFFPFWYRRRRHRLRSLQFPYIVRACIYYIDIRIRSESQVDVQCFCLDDFFSGFCCCFASSYVSCVYASSFRCCQQKEIFFHSLYVVARAHTPHVANTFICNSSCCRLSGKVDTQRHQQQHDE